MKDNEDPCKSIAHIAKKIADAVKEPVDFDDDADFFLSHWTNNAPFRSSTKPYDVDMRPRHVPLRAKRFEKTDPEYKTHYPEISSPFSEQEKREGYYELENFLRGVGPYGSGNFDLLMPENSGPPPFGLIIGPFQHGIAACLYVRLSAKKDEQFWTMKKMEMAPAYVRTRALRRLPIWVQIEQAERKDWLRKVFRFELAKSSLAIYGAACCEEPKYAHLFSQRRPAMESEKNVRRMNLAISLLFRFWETENIPFGERVGHLDELGLLPKKTDGTPTITARNLGTTVNRLGLKIMRLQG